MKTANKLTNLSKIISIINSPNYKEPELTELVNLVQKISLSYLKYQEVMGMHICQKGSQNASELEDVALDCIAGLFVRNQKGEFVLLRKYFNQNCTDFKKLENFEIWLLLKRLVIKKTKQELSRIFKERDPEAAKINRNIKIAIKTASDFASFKSRGREYICLAEKNRLKGQNLCINNKDADHDPSSKVNLSKKIGNRVISAEYLRKGQPGIPEKTLLNQYLNLFSPNDRVPTSIRKMLSIIKNDCRYQNYLPFDTVASILRQTNSVLIRDRLESQNMDLSPLDHFQLKEIEKRKIYVSKKIKKKIETHYVSSNKISDRTGKIYYKALLDVLDDISQGKKVEAYSQYLRRHMNSLTRQDYRKNDRTTFEYLCKLMKEWLRESLLELYQ